MVAPTFKAGSGTSVSSTSAVLIPSSEVSSGGIAGDLLVFVLRLEADRTPVVNFGHTPIGGNSGSEGSVLGTPKVQLYTRTALASEPDNYIFSWIGDTDASLTVLRYAGGTVSGNLIVNGLTTPPLYVPDANSRLIVGATNYASDSTALSSPVAVTDRVTNTTGSGSKQLVGDLVQSSAGSATQYTYTANEFSDAEMAFAIAIRGPGGELPSIDAEAELHIAIPPLYTDAPSITAQADVSAQLPGLLTTTLPGFVVENTLSDAAYESKSIVAEEFSSSFSPSLPAGTAEGDVLIAACWALSSSAITGKPAGWEIVTLGSATGVYLNVYSRVVGAGESAPTFTSGSATHGYVALYRFSDVDTTTPVNASGWDGGTTSAPAVTTSIDGTINLRLYGSGYGSGQVVTPPGTALDNPANSFVTVGAGYAEQTHAGDSGTAAFTDTGGAGDHVTATIALAPSVASSTDNSMHASLYVPVAGPLSTTPELLSAEAELFTQVPGLLTTTLDAVAAEAELPQIPGAPLLTQLDTLSAEVNEFVPVPGTLITTPLAVTLEATINEIANTVVYTALPSLGVTVTPFNAEPGPFTTSMPPLSAEGELFNLSLPPFITVLPVVGAEGEPVAMLPGLLTTSYALPINATASLASQVPGPLTTTPPLIESEAEPFVMLPPPFITIVPAIDAEAEPFVMLPGPLTTTADSISAELRTFRPFMQSLSEVYRIYIGSESLTGNVGSGSQKILDERTTSPYAGRLKDENGDNVAKSVLDACQLIVYDKITKTVIRETRDAIDLIETDGTVDWMITPFETSLINSESPVGQNEPHIATFEFAWDSEDFDDYSLSFATTAGSQIVTVTHAIHGLAAEDHVVFKGAPAVGGLEMDGVFVVVSVTDSNTYTVKHINEASSTASATETVTVYRRPMATKHYFEFQVRKREIQ